MQEVPFCVKTRSMPMQNFTRNPLSFGKNVNTAGGELHNVDHLRFTPKADVLRRITDYSKALEICATSQSGSFDVVVN
jgi:hypothetical protein